MSRKPILIPVVHRPALPELRDGPTFLAAEAAVLIVPHYAESVQPEIYQQTYGALPRLHSSMGFEAHLPYPRTGRNEPRPGFPASYEGMETDWLTEPRWTGELSVTGYWGGRSSSCYAVSIDVGDGPLVTGLMSCLAFRDLIPLLSGGKLRGIWTARKQGQNYLIVRADAPEEQP